MEYKTYRRHLINGQWEMIGVRNSLSEAVALMAAFIGSSEEMKINTPNGRTIVRYDPMIDLSNIN